MKTFLVATAMTAAFMTTAAPAATMTFSGLSGSQVSQATYTEDGIIAAGTEGTFWGYPNGGELHLDPGGFSNAVYDFTFSGGTFDLASLDVSFASGGAIGTFTAFDAFDMLIGTAVFDAATTGSRAFDLSGITRLRLVDTGNHFSIDNLVLNATAAVPEPATWTMMMMGFGAIAGAIRRRARTTTVRFA